MDEPKPIIPIDVLLIHAINVVVALVVYYLIVPWRLMEG
jgi:hypothetical protein